MRWLLAGCCGLVLISFSVAVNERSSTLHVSQKPRFYGVLTGRRVGIYCVSSKRHSQETAQWFKAPRYDKKEEKTQLFAGGRTVISNFNQTKDAILILTNLQVEDQGVYFCEINGILGPGTEVHVASPVNIGNALYRSQLKDGLMVLQGLLLAFCIAAILLRKQSLLEKKDSLYEEPETDHIYEGLAIESCGVDLYEDLSVYAQADGAEAPWE
ncbi:uncharacterized protein cd79b [Sphaeramia orbicularis]|uniref:Uncharacterized LOC115410318 n=1 Tax=Sphaeramia orbicularis TaxID=375764 RepID=A0A673AB38_9TELE|nr:uncharacterized protein LOC115410318 [Sphaeramia orbicularis]